MLVMLEISQALEKMVKETTTKLLSLDKTSLDHKPSLSRWSKKEILGHLIDSANNNLNRFIRGQYENQPHIVYDQDQWVAIQNYQALPFDEVLQLWAAANRQIVNVLKNIPSQNYGLQCDTGKGQKELHSLSWLADDYLKHMRHHLGQIFN